VVNLFLEKDTRLDDDTHTYLKMIVDIATLAISHFRGKLFIKNGIAKPDLDETNTVLDSKTITEIRHSAIRSERTRLAREIHDGLAQILGYVKLQLSQSIEILYSGENRELNRLIHSSYQAISDAYIDAREAIDDLHYLPYTENFFVWLRETTKEFEKNFNIETILTGWPNEIKFPPNIYIHLTRMLQEILSNIRKHAKAEIIEIIHKRDEDYTLLEIRDNGIGIQNNLATDRSHHGLRNLRERAELINADLEITGIEGVGTIIQIRLANDKFRWSS
jgi:two-component system nitrate/nitrite sensor histidine kinase NarX